MTGMVMITKGGGCGGGGGGEGRGTKGSGGEEQNSLSVVAFLVAALRKSMVSCRVDRREDVMSAVQQMEIGWPTNVRHITHVTFDRFNGFLGLPVEFEVEIPCRVPSARFPNPFSFFHGYSLFHSSFVYFLLFLSVLKYSYGDLSNWRRG